MQISKYPNITIIAKSEIFRHLGFLYNSAQAIYPFILVPSHVYENLLRSKPNAHYESVIVHENFHIIRAKEFGVIRWYLMYAINPKFRLNEEILAIKEQVKFASSRGIDLDLEKIAKFLSSWAYLKMVSYEKALRIIKGL